MLCLEFTILYVHFSQIQYFFKSFDSVWKPCVSQYSSDKNIK